MIVAFAKEIAIEWVHQNLCQAAGVTGALFHGSIHTLPDEATLPPASDIDILVVKSDADSDLKPGKFVYRGVMLEVSYLAESELATAEAVLGAYHLAGSFRFPGIIYDPSGHLTNNQAIVEREFARERWVRARCADAHSRLHRNLQGIDSTSTFHDAVTAWLFAGGVATHILLVAGLRNPTVRKRYLEVEQLLNQYGESQLYPLLLSMIGADGIPEERVQSHLDALAIAFDTAAETISSPFFFAADISSLAKPIAIGGSQELIDQGHHREAVFWIVATYARCMTVFAQDGTPALYARHETGFRALLADLGINTRADLLTGKGRIESLLPAVWEVAGSIIQANPEILHTG